MRQRCRITLIGNSANLAMPKVRFYDRGVVTYRFRRALSDFRTVVHYDNPIRKRHHQIKLVFDQ